MAIKHKLAPAVAVSALALVGLSAAETASAADCSLGQQRIQGRGASFQNTAHNGTAGGWIINAGCVVDGGGLISFNAADKDPQEAAASPANTGFNAGNDLVFYDSQGSGNGLAAFGAGTGSAPKFSNVPGQRDNQVSFIGTDDPATPAQSLTMEEGGNVVAGADNAINDDDDGVFHTIPVAQSSVAVIVKTPLGCKLPAGLVYNKRMLLAAGPAGKANSTVEQLFSGEITTWGQLGWKNTSDGLPCSQPLRRVVRRDNSGTTFGFKTFLASTDQGLGGATNWAAHDETGENNTIWPGKTVADAYVDNEGACDGVDSSVPGGGPAAEGDFVCQNASSNGNGGLADTLNATTSAGGIGFADLATARSKNFGWLNTSDRTYWLPLRAANSPTTVIDAAEAAQGFKQGGAKGANCQLAEYGINGVGGVLPTNTKGDWSAVYQDQTPTQTQYPLCLLTYAGAWEDYNDVYPNTTLSCTDKSARQTAVKNYLQYVLGTTAGGDEGQTLLSSNDYAAIPASISLKSATYFTQAAFKKAPNDNVC